MKKIKYITPYLLLIALVSCTKVIDIDLNSSNPHMIVEANINTNPGPYTVKLSNTVNFDESNVFPPVTGATVIISDDFSNIDTLQEVTPGLYQTTFIQGLVNRNYYLYINNVGSIYTAQSFINPLVTLDSIIAFQQPNPFSGPPFNLVSPNFNDPAGIENYYKLNETINGEVLTNISISDDKSFDGQTYNRPLFSFGNPLEPGDTVEIELLSIDKAVYTYYFGFSQLSGFGINQSASPANPKSNITGNSVLGYFNAYSSDKKIVIIP